MTCINLVDPSHLTNVHLINDDTYRYWKPSPEEIYLNMARLCRRSKLDNILQELSSNS